jgi:hypothetical protein
MRRGPSPLESTTELRRVAERDGLGMTGRTRHGPRPTELPLIEQHTP